MARNSTTNNDKVNGARVPARSRYTPYPSRMQGAARSITTANSTAATSVTGGEHPGGDVTAAQAPITEHPTAPEQNNVQSPRNMKEPSPTVEEINLEMPDYLATPPLENSNDGSSLLGIGAWMNESRRSG